VKILLLAGGKSNEREVSLRTGDNIEAALSKAGYDILRLDPANKDFDLAKVVADVDLVFPILHGEGGEDGVLQAEMERLKVPFLGSGSEVAKLTFNKVAYKKRLAEHGILTPNWQVVNLDDFGEAGLIHQSFVLKPIQGGSSIDTFIVHNPRHQALNFQEPLRRYGSMLLEELIEGQEITVGVLGHEALPVILIIPPPGEEFDYDNKYNGKTQEITNPRQVPAKLQKDAQELALKVHRLMGCRHLSRTDIIVSPSGSLYVLETNTIPGLTKQSLLPKAAHAKGLEATDLVEKMVMLTQEKTP
jgi:D-alanine-D-alanine ligase